MADPEQTLIVLNHVPADRAQEFEDWVGSVVVPAMRDHQPHLEGRWRVLRATEADDGVVVFAFVCEGGAPDDWELQPVLEKALGPEGADRALEQFAGLLGREQYGWFFTPVRYDDAGPPRTSAGAS